MRAPALSRHPHANAPRNGWFPQGLISRRDRRRRRRPAFALEVLEDRTLPAASVLGSVWNELLADGRRGGEPGLAQTRVFLDLDHDGHFGSQRSAYNASTVQFTPGPFQAGDFITPLTPGGLPGDISDLNVRIDVTNNTTGGMLVGLFTPAGRLVGQGASLFTLGPGERFTGLIDDQAATPIGGASAPYKGEFRPLEPLTGPNARGRWSSPSPSRPC
jgi:hypothetical protein